MPKQLFWIRITKLEMRLPLCPACNSWGAIREVCEVWVMAERRVVKGTEDLDAPQRPESPVVWIYLISFAQCVLIKKQKQKRKHEIKIKKQNAFTQ